MSEKDITKSDIYKIVSGMVSEDDVIGISFWIKALQDQIISLDEAAEPHPKQLTPSEICESGKAEMEDKWISVDDELPGNNLVLATYKNSLGNRRKVVAFYVNEFEMECDHDDGDCCCEYSEEKDGYYLREGWLESIENWGDYSSVYITEGEVDYWMPLPKAPDHLISKGEKG